MLFAWDQMNPDEFGVCVGERTPKEGPADRDYEDNGNRRCLSARPSKLQAMLCNGVLRNRQTTTVTKSLPLHTKPSSSSNNYERFLITRTRSLITRTRSVKSFVSSAPTGGTTRNRSTTAVMEPQTNVCHRSDGGFKKYAMENNGIQPRPYTTGGPDTRRNVTGGPYDRRELRVGDRRVLSSETLAASTQKILEE